MTYQIQSEKKDRAKIIDVAAPIVPMLLFTLLILMRDIAGLSVSKYIFVAIAVAYFLVADKKSTYCFFAFLTPLATGLPITYICCLALVVLFLKNRKTHYSASGMIGIALILLLELMSVWRGSFELLEYIRFAGKFALPLLLLADREYDYDYQGMLNKYLVGFCVAMTSIIGQMFTEYSLQDLLTLGIRFGNTKDFLGEEAESMIVSYNQNGLGVLCVMAAAICILLIRNKKRGVYYIVLACATLIGVMTQSRAFMVAFIAMLLLFLLFSCTTVQKAIKNLLYLAIGGVVAYQGAMLLIPQYVESLIKRFGQADISNGRNEIMIDYFNGMLESVDRVIFGVGIQNYREHYNMYDSAHNSTQEILVAWGMIGLIIIGIFLVHSLYVAKRHGKASWEQCVPLFVFLLISQSGQGFSNSSFSLCLMVCYAAVTMNVKTITCKENMNLL